MRGHEVDQYEFSDPLNFREFRGAWCKRVLIIDPLQNVINFSFNPNLNASLIIEYSAPSLRSMKYMFDYIPVNLMKLYK